MTENLTLTLAATATVTDTRTFTGTAVTYGEVTQDGRNITFAKGAFGDLNSQSLTAVLLQHPYNKGEKAISVGRVEAWTDSDDTLSFSARLNDSEAADTVYEALKAGEINSVSVGVYVSEFSESEDGITSFSDASLLELSLITEGEPALENSKILAVFSDQAEVPATSSTQIKDKEIPMEIEAQVADLANSVDEISRQFSVFSEDRPAVNAESKFQSFGAVVKAVAAGDEQAIAELTEFAYTGGVSGDTTVKQAWANPLIKIIDQGRPVLSLFDKLPDPKANVIEYLKLDTNTIDVAEQVNEGDDLSYGKIDLTSETTGMKTFGGWTNFSQQQLDRSDVGVVDLAYRALASKYAQVTEARVRSVFLASATSQAVSGFDASNYGKVVDAVVDANTQLSDAGHSAEFIVCSADNFKKLALMDSGSANDFVLSRDNGSVNVPGISATLFGIPVKVVTGTGVFVFTNSHAVTVWESGVGRLQDSNIINLTSNYSLYGYLGAAVTDATAIVSRKA